MASPGAGASSGVGSVTLPYDASLAPPNAIVNGAQLEMEVMRMLANAVLFNPGSEELVLEARAMFEGIEGVFDQWRETEKG